MTGAASGDTVGACLPAGRPESSGTIPFAEALVSSPVELIVGPARSGKGRCVLEAYLAALAEAEPGKTLMLVPTALRRRARAASWRPKPAASSSGRRS